MKYCAKCGNQLDDSASFCSKCGTDNIGPVQKTGARRSLLLVSEKSTLIIISLVFVFLALSIFLPSFTTNYYNVSKESYDGKTVYRYDETYKDNYEYYYYNNDNKINEKNTSVIKLITQLNYRQNQEFVSSYGKQPERYSGILIVLYGYVAVTVIICIVILIPTLKNMNRKDCLRENIGTIKVCSIIGAAADIVMWIAIHYICSDTQKTSYNSYWGAGEFSDFSFGPLFVFSLIAYTAICVYMLLLSKYDYPPALPEQHNAPTDIVNISENGFCPNCGFKYDSTAKFCKKCGAKIDDEIHTYTDINATEINRTSVQNDHSKPKMLVAAILCTVLILSPFIPLISATYAKMIRSNGTDGTGYEYESTDYDYALSRSSNNQTASYFELFKQLHYRMRYYSNSYSETKKSYNDTIDRLTEERKSLKVSDFDYSSYPEREYEDRYNELGESIKNAQNALEDYDSYKVSRYLIIMLIICIVVMLMIFSCIYNTVRMWSKLGKDNKLFWKHSKRCGLKFIIAHVLFFLSITILMNIEIKQDKLWGDPSFNTFKNFEYGFLFFAVVAVSIFVFAFSINEYGKIKTDHKDETDSANNSND